MMVLLIVSVVPPKLTPPAFVAAPLASLLPVIVLFNSVSGPPGTRMPPPPEPPRLRLLAIVLLVTLNSAPELWMPPPLPCEVLPTTELAVTASEPELKMPPPKKEPLWPVLRVTLELVRVSWPSLRMPAPSPPGKPVFWVMVQPVRLAREAASLRMAPPSWAVLLEKVELVAVSLAPAPVLSMAPPEFPAPGAVLFEIVTFVSVRMPLFRIAPPALAAPELPPVMVRSVMVAATVALTTNTREALLPEMVRPSCRSPV